jgi:hypothetical protein
MIEKISGEDMLRYERQYHLSNIRSLIDFEEQTSTVLCSECYYTWPTLHPIRGPTLYRPTVFLH